MNIITLPDGFIVPDDECIAKFQKETGRLDHDFFLTPFACEQIPVGGTVIDVGALCGDHTIAYARKVGKDGIVIAIEPGKDAFDCLAKNAQKFEANVICVPCAASDEHGSGASHRIDPKNVGASEIKLDCEAGMWEGAERVHTVSIDRLMEDGKIPSLDFMKIDCEGCELRVLKGAKKTIFLHKPKLLIEINKPQLKKHGCEAVDVCDFLFSMGYKWKIVQFYSKESDECFDILSWHSSVEDPVMPKDPKLPRKSN